MLHALQPIVHALWEGLPISTAVELVRSVLEIAPLWSRHLLTLGSFQEARGGALEDWYKWGQVDPTLSTYIRGRVLGCCALVCYALFRGTYVESHEIFLLQLLASTDWSSHTSNRRRYRKKIPVPTIEKRRQKAPFETNRMNYENWSRTKRPRRNHVCCTQLLTV